VLVALVAAGALLAACTSSPRTTWRQPTAPTAPSPSPAGFAVAPAQWRACPEVAQGIAGHQPRNTTIECATVKVPRDWANPGDGRTFDLSLLRSRATGQRDRIGSLMVNPGGPGGSGVELAVYLAESAPADVIARFDIVGFDPRGVGRSSPLACVADADKDALIGTDGDPRGAGFDDLVALTRRAYDACGRKYGDDLRLYSTAQAARDLDALRTAVGDDKLSYLGYSYGTLLGAVYAHLFPARARAMVLDGAVDPSADEIAAAEGQAAGFEHAFDDFATWCRQTPNLCPIGPDARATLTGLYAQLRDRPLRGPGGRSATVGIAQTAVVSALYAKTSWPRLAAALSDLRDGDPRRAFALSDGYWERDDGGHYSNMFEAFIAISCADEATTVPLERARQLQAEWRDRYPLFGGLLGTGLTSCALWPGKHDPYQAGKAEGAPPIVVVGTRHDPATPYVQTAKLATLLGTGQVLTWEGEGHTAYPQTTCVTAAVNAYLVNLTTPQADLTCPVS